MWNDTRFHSSVWTVVKKKKNCFFIWTTQPSHLVSALGFRLGRKPKVEWLYGQGTVWSYRVRAAWFHLKIHNNVWRRALHFHFVLGLQNDVCLVVRYVLCCLTQTSLLLKAEKRLWYRGKRRRLSGGKRACGGSGNFGEMCSSQGLGATSTREGEMRCVVLSLRHSSGSVPDEPILCWSFCKILVKPTDQRDFYTYLWRCS